MSSAPDLTVAKLPSLMIFRKSLPTDTKLGECNVDEYYPVW
jgi:hypothetical protein